MLHTAHSDICNISNATIIVYFVFTSFSRFVILKPGIVFLLLSLKAGNVVQNVNAHTPPKSKQGLLRFVLKSL